MRFTSLDNVCELIVSIDLLRQMMIPIEDEYGIDLGASLFTDAWTQWGVI